ncbi:unnamed protein product [[Candida] boidinii]|uniref:Unnamed protein product n=1 Tax=Candida boidinii TaxID=5477 RepID=A0A9W6T0G9_CANBO|nr:unnamed protein product [[Candida] boidinii]
MSSYIRRTCIYCRQKRKKCDGKSPCSVCVSLSQNCIYQPEIDRRRRKYNTDYVEYLESKSQKLEKFILDFVKDDKDLEFNAKDIIKSLTLRIPNNNNDGDFSSTSTSTNSNSNNNINDSNDESQFSNLSSSINHRSDTLTELGDDIAFNELLTMAKNMSLENNDQKNDSYQQKKFNYQNSTFNDGIHASQNYQRRRNDLLRSKYLDSNSSPDDFPLKTDGISISFVDESFRQELIHNFINHCCEVSYIVSLTLPTINSWEFPSTDPSHQLLMCTVYGMGCIFSSNQYAKEVTKILISEAENMVLSTCRFESNQYLVQSLFLLSCYEMGNGNDSVSYLFISMAAALTQHMGYHISYDENSSAARFAPKTTHFKSALLWSICTQDRIVTTSLGVPSCIHFKRIISPFYTPESSMNSEDKESYLLEISFSYISRLWYILDRFLDQICSIQGDIGDTQERSKLVLTAKNTLIDLKALLPPQLKNVEKIGNYHILMFHLNYEVCFILLYRLLLNELPLEGSNNCISSALNATKLIERLVYSINDFIPSYEFGFLVNTVAIVLLVYLVERNTKSKKDNKMSTSSIKRDIYYNSFITCLKALYLDTRYWSRSLNNIKLLSDFAIMNGFHCDELIYTDNLIKISAANSQQPEFENSEFENSEIDNSEFDSEI